MKRKPLGPDEIRMPTELGSPVRVLAMEMDREVPLCAAGATWLDVVDGSVQPDLTQDALDVTVVERYGKTTNLPVAIVCGLGLAQGHWPQVLLQTTTTSSAWVLAPWTWLLRSTR